MFCSLEHAFTNEVAFLWFVKSIRLRDETSSMQLCETNFICRTEQVIVLFAEEEKLTHHLVRIVGPQKDLQLERRIETAKPTSFAGINEATQICTSGQISKPSRGSGVGFTPKHSAKQAYVPSTVLHSSEQRTMDTIPKPGSILCLISKSQVR